jgi:hypothetical protein
MSYLRVFADFLKKNNVLAFPLFCDLVSMQQRLPNNNNPDFILYFLPQDPNCTKLIESFGLRAGLGATEMNHKHVNKPNIYLQNVTLLPPAQRPAWLTGVPTLVDVHKKLVHIGTNVTSELTRAFLAVATSPSTFLPASTHQQQRTSNAPAAPPSVNSDHQSVATPAAEQITTTGSSAMLSSDFTEDLFHSSVDAPAAVDMVTGGGPKKELLGGKVTDQDIQNYIQQYTSRHRAKEGFVPQS